MKNFYTTYKKSCVAALIIFGCVVFYSICGFLGAPWLLKSVVPSLLADKNATLVIKQVKFNPYKFELNATGVSLKSHSEIFSVDELDLGINVGQIFAKNINIDIIRLKEPFLNIERDENLRFNFENLSSSDEKSDQSDDSESFFNLTLNKFEIINGDIRYADRSLKRPFDMRLRDLSYEIVDVNLKDYSAGKHLLNTNSTLLDEFDWNGGVSLNPLRIYGDIKFAGLKVDKIWQSYMSDSDLNLTKGLLDTSLNYGLVIDDKGIAVDINNSKLTARNFKITDKNSTIKFDDFWLYDFDFAGKFDSANLIDLVLDEGQISGFSLDELGVNKLNVNDFVVNVTKDKNLDIKGSIKSLKIDDVEQNSTTKISVKKGVINQIKYDTNDGLRFGFDDFNGTKFSLNAGFGLGFDDFYLKNLKANLNSDFTALQLNVPSFGLNSTKFSGFDFDVGSKNFSFSDLNVSLEQNLTKLNTQLSKIKTTPIEILAKKQKFILSNGISADKIKLSGDRLSLDSLNLDKTDVFSANQNFTGFKQIAIDGISYDLLKPFLDIKNIKVNSLFYNDSLDENGSKSINSLALMKEQEIKKSSKQSEQKPSEFGINIDTIDFLNLNSNITQSFLNEPIKHEIIVKNAKISKFSSDFTKPFEISADITTSEKIGIDTKGKVSITPFKTDLDISLILSDLSRLNHITKQYINAEISSGEIAAKSKFKFDKSFDFVSDFSLKNFTLNDANLTKVIELKNASINKIELNQNQLSIKNLLIDDSFIKAHLDVNKSLNLANLVKKGSENLEQNQTKTEGKNDEFKVGIENIDLRRLNVDFIDDGLVLPFVFHIKNFNTKIDKIQSGEISHISSNGVIGSGGSANLNMRLDVFDFKNFSDIKLKFKDVELNEITPYTATFVGRKINSGLLDLALDYEIKEHKMQGKNNIIINTIKLGDEIKSESAISLPLQLAISILQDSNNVIDLNLPVSGDMDNPEFSYASIVFKAVMQIFSDVVTSPFRLLGKVLGVANADEMAGVDFEAGIDDLMDSQSKKIENFKKITDAKSDMIFIISPAFDEQVDTFALQKRALNREINQYQKNGASEFDAIKTLANQRLKNPPKDPYNELARLNKIDKSELESLARNRAENLLNAMISAGVPQNQVKISDKIENVKAKLDLYIALPMGIENKK